MRSRRTRGAAVLLASAALAACSSQKAAVEPSARPVSRDCQAFVDHFRPVAMQLLEVRTFAMGEAYLPIIRPSRDKARVEVLAQFIERPTPAAPTTAPTLLTEMQEIAKEQTSDTRGLLAALERADLESYRRLSIRYRSSRERLLTLDDSLDASCATHLLPRGHVPFAQAAAIFQPHDAAFKKCRQTGGAQRAHLADRLDVKLVIDERGAVQTVEVDPGSHEPVLDPGTEPFFVQLGYVPPAEGRASARRDPMDPGVTACILGEVRTLRFDPIRGGATLRFPVMLNGQAPAPLSDD